MTKTDTFDTGEARRGNLTWSELIRPRKFVGLGRRVNAKQVAATSTPKLPEKGTKNEGT